MRLTTANVPTVDSGAIDAIVGAYHGDPFAVLGMHQAGEHLAVRVFRPDARAVTVRGERRDGSYPALQVHADGFFEAVLEDRTERFSYELDFTGHDGARVDGVRPVFLWRRSSGRSISIFSPRASTGSFTRSSARTSRRSAACAARAFAVWAPNAQRVSVVGDFNGWDGRRNPMRKLLGCGVWEIFLPGVGEGAHYKFEVKQSHGGIVLKSDPFAFFRQHGTQTASLVFDLKRYTWDDAEWMEAAAAAASGTQRR